MSTTVKRLLYWTPRVLCLLFAAFISLFALDVFGEGYGFWETIGALLIHLIPTWLVLIALALAWRWEWVGALLLVGLGMGYVIMAWGRFDPIAYLLISGPLFLAGILFLLNWLFRAEIRSSR